VKSYRLSWPWAAVIVAALAAATTIAVALITQSEGRISPWWLLPTAAVALATGVLAAAAASRTDVACLRKQVAKAKDELRRTSAARDDVLERLRAVQRQLEARATYSETRGS
jgi:hypothetical protein